MSPITIGILFLIFGFIFGISKFLYTGYSFTKYIKEKYPIKWKEMTENDSVRRVLLPFGNDTVTYFIYKSKKDFGDDNIAQFRKKIRQHTFFLAVVYPISFVIYIVVAFWFMKTLETGGSFTFLGN